MTSPLQDYLEGLHRQLLGETGGKVATYIPELAKADSAAFGIVIATVDGRVYEAGDTRRAFTLQSISKPLVYGLALQDQGEARVRQSVGIEPSGEAFNSISLEADTGRPMNPMINAGAIATSSLVRGDTATERLARVMSTISTYAGRDLAIDEAVFESERVTGHRNRAIGHLLRNYDILGEDPDSALDLYFRQCSVLLDCRDLALIGATLANGGTHPLTGRSAVKADLTGPILSVMATCGVYDFTGEWIYRVGLPAKSGVGGGILAVLPGQLGIGVYSPALDERGNSVRGIKACEAISSDLGLHFLQPPRASAFAVRARYSLADVRSKRPRPAAESRLLAEHGAAAMVYELQGDLRLATIEPVLHEITERASALQFAVLDFKRVSHVDHAATRMLAALIVGCARRGQKVVLTRVRRGALLAGLDAEVDPRAAAALIYQPQLDLGLEWCERELLRGQGGQPPPPSIERLADHALCHGATSKEVAWLEANVSRTQYEPGLLLVRSGEPADAIFLIMRGEVSVVLDLPGGGQRRLSTLSAGMSFGEAALFDSGTRSAHVRADTPVECCLLDLAHFARMESECPTLAIRLLRNLLQATMRTVVRLTQEVAALEG